MIPIIGVLLVAALPGMALADAGGGGDVGGMEDLGALSPADALPDGSVAPTPDATGVGPDTSTSAGAEPVEEPIVGSTPSLKEQLARVTAERDAAQQRLLAQTDALEGAAGRLDAVVLRYAARIGVLLDSGQSTQLDALMEVRESPDVDRRAELVATLAPEDQRLAADQTRIAAEVAAATAAADALRSDVLTLGMRIDAIKSVIEARATPGADGETHESINADYIFATGPIPGIGYWGAATGGDALAGWSGLVGAAIGGVGCEPPSPDLKATGQIEQGEASWYGPGFNGNNTANGEVYDQTAMTAAHKTLPFGTIVRVYSSATAKCAFVRINDRGPYIDGRIIDLSETAATAIGMSGTAPVQIEVWSAGDAAGASNAPV